MALVSLESLDLACAGSFETLCSGSLGLHFRHSFFLLVLHTHADLSGLSRRSSPEILSPVATCSCHVFASPPFSICGRAKTLSESMCGFPSSFRRTGVSDRSRQSHFILTVLPKRRIACCHSLQISRSVTRRGLLQTPMLYWHVLRQNIRMGLRGSALFS